MTKEVKVMADPVIVACPEGEWTKVATAVQTGMVNILIKTPNYYHTYRDTGGDAPTDKSEAVPLMQPGGKISSGVDIDVYIWAEAKAGSVRVDLE